jgi:uncharacterized protein HemY
VISIQQMVAAITGRRIAAAQRDAGDAESELAAVVKQLDAAQAEIVRLGKENHILRTDKTSFMLITADLEARNDP